MQDDTGVRRAAPSAAQAAAPGALAAGGRETVLGAYGGVAYTHPSIVRIVNPGRTDLSVSDFTWIGRPFKLPPYYGLRVQRWDGAGPFGMMLDFTHAKAIAARDDVATFSGARDGQPVSPKARIGDVFRHLEFSHGHNLLLANGLARLPAWWGRVRPYVGLGGGVSLPHTEVGFAGARERTYTYQFAGLAGQLLGGVEIDLGRLSVFLEYKLTYVPQTVPLSHEPYGWLFVTDLWGQLRDWLAGRPPPGGWLSTRLLTHHGIGGISFRWKAKGAPG